MTASDMHNFNPGILKIAKCISGSSVAFVIDTSDSMVSNLELMKAFTIELIDILMCQIDNFSFNVISFADTYSKLSKTMLPCNKSSAHLAGEWIQTLNCDTTKNTLLALGTAYIDNDVDAVIMLTDGLLTQKSPEVIDCVADLSQGRPLHVIYINEESEGDDVLQFLESLAMNTNGTLHTIKHHSKCVLQEEQLYPNHCGVNSTSSSSNSSSSDDNDEKEENCEDDEEIKLLGKVVLAKRNSNGYYYQGTIIKTTSSSEDVVVLFHPSKDKTAQLQQKCLSSELIFYDEACEEKIYADDKVLVNLDGRKRFIPASVIKKEYIFDDAFKEGQFTKILEVELINGDTKNIPITSAVHIALECYERIVNGIKDKSTRKSKECIEENEESNTDCLQDISKGLSGSLQDISKGLLRDKIERQLRESEEFLRNLHTKTKEERQLRESEMFLRNLHTKAKEAECSEDICTREFRKKYCDDSSTSSAVDRIPYPKYSKVKIPNYNVYEDGESNITPISTHQVKGSPLHSQNNAEKRCTFMEPLPPVSWNNSTKMKRNNCSNPRTMRQLTNVGCNAVELSKKHWKGRPISKETSPKRPFNERLTYKSKIGAPKAEEYQTTDGIPFPIKTDKRFRKENSASWTPGAEKAGDYMHHDIISHRIVNPNKPSEKLTTHEESNDIKEKRRISTRRIKEKVRKENQDESRRHQLEERDEQLRKQIEDRINDECIKIRLTIEKDDDVLKTKQHKQAQQRDFEREREGKNQKWKHARIADMKEKRKTVHSVEEKDKRKTVHSVEEKDERKTIHSVEEKDERPATRSQHVQTHDNTSRREKRSDFERSRIEKQIEDHESKIDRLKGIRKSTEARFRSMRQENDKHRDVSYYVRDQQTGTIRASVLP